jgi:hypothetical protein
MKIKLIRKKKNIIEEQKEVDINKMVQDTQLKKVLTKVRF